MDLSLGIKVSALISTCRKRVPATLLCKILEVLNNAHRSQFFSYYEILEDGTFERFSVTSQSSTFRYGKATEQAREQIGAVTLYVGDGETVSSFFEDVQTRIRKLHKFSLGSRPAQPQIEDIKVTRLVHDILQPAAFDVIHEREGRDRSMNATQTYSIFIIYIKRSRTRRISLEPTSIAS